LTEQLRYLPSTRRGGDRRGLEAGFHLSLTLHLAGRGLEGKEGRTLVQNRFLETQSGEIPPPPDLAEGEGEVANAPV